MTMGWQEIVELLRLDLLSYLLLAVLLGGGIGLQRELRGKAAGLRTNILICVGAALFTQMSQTMAVLVGDPTRIAAQIVTGVGFLGAGAILHGKGYVSGLTSAATIWLVAAIGMAVGTGALYEASGAALLVILVLGVLGKFESYLRTRQEISRVELELAPDPNLVVEVEEIVTGAGLSIEEMRSEKQRDKIVVSVTMKGPKRLQDKAKRGLIQICNTFTITEDE
ncbi:MAG: MgtC/SapB family protein [Gemmatimonadetes bacterium]|nr:MgtC/SapB family protein [Gemmatimonadota bacterium]